jgi:hypothetical protein
MRRVAVSARDDGLAESFRGRPTPPQATKRVPTSTPFGTDA